MAKRHRNPMDHQSAGDRVISVVTYIVYAFFAFVCAYPFYYIIINSISANNLSERGKVLFWPMEVHFKNYTRMASIPGLLDAAKGVKVVVSVEEHSPFGGLGSMVSQVIGANDPKKVINLALPDAPVITGTSKEVFDHYGLNAEGIAKTVVENLN